VVFLPQRWTPQRWGSPTPQKRVSSPGGARASLASVVPISVVIKYAESYLARFVGNDQVFGPKEIGYLGIGSLKREWTWTVHYPYFFD